MDKAKIDFLKALWDKYIEKLSTIEDIKKIKSLLQNVAIIDIDEKKKKAIIGAPNEFMLLQVKKFFKPLLEEITKELYNPAFGISLKVDPSLNDKKNPLLIDLKKVLKTQQKEVPILDQQTKKILTDYFGILFNPKYKFENFIVWANNQLAFSAAQAVAQKPGQVYNPLFIYWDVGLGKTHLLQAIWNYTLKNHPDKTIVYLPTTKFIDKIIEAIKGNKLSSLIKKLEGLDILILDDIQFLAEKEKTQEIFHNIFNELYLKRKQIILSSDRPPRDLSSLEARLRSRFAMGLVVDIKPPDFETRIAILKQKLAEKWEDLPMEFLEIIAKHITTNIRELEGALNHLITVKKLQKRELTKDDVYNAIKILGIPINSNGQTPIQSATFAQSLNTTNEKSFSKLVDFIANYYSISPQDIRWDSRKKEISIARQMLMYLAKNRFGWTLEKIGDYFGGKNHSSVIYSINNFQKLLKRDPKIAKDREVINNHLW